MLQKSEGNHSRRMLMLAVCIVTVFAIFAVTLFRIQIVRGDYYANLADTNVTTVIGVPASRGEILDRNFLPVAVNRTTYAIIFDYNYFPTGTGEEQQQQQNDCLRRLGCNGR